MVRVNDARKGQRAEETGKPVLKTAKMRGRSFQPSLLAKPTLCLVHLPAALAGAYLGNHLSRRDSSDRVLNACQHIDRIQGDSKW